MEGINVIYNISKNGNHLDQQDNGFFFQDVTHIKFSPSKYFYIHKL